MFTLGKVLISTRGLAPGNYHFYMNAKPSVAMVQGEMCQCPLGLIPHFYQYLPLFRISQAVSVSMPSRAYTSFLQICKVVNYWVATRVNALSGLYLISTTFTMNTVSRLKANVSMPSRAYTSFLRSPFKNLDFMRFSEPVFAGIYQNILITAVFRAC